MPRTYLNRDKLALELDREKRLKAERLSSQEQLVDIAKRRLDAAKEIYKTIGTAAVGKVKYDLDLAYFQAEAENVKAQIELKELRVSQELFDRRHQLELRQIEIREPDRVDLDRQIELARLGRDQTMVLAPAAGRVLDLSVRAGEVSTGPLLALGDLAAMDAVAEVYQSDLPEIKLGDPAEVVVLGRKVTGKVTRISRLVGREYLGASTPAPGPPRRAGHDPA